MNHATDLYYTVSIIEISDMSGRQSIEQGSLLYGQS